MADSEKLEKKLKGLEEKLDAQVAKAKRAQTTTIVVGVILILFIIIYFSVISSQVRGLMEPESVAQIASEEAVQQVRNLRPELERIAKEQAPELVDRVIDEALLAQLKEGRIFLQEEIKKEANGRLEGMSQFIIEEFDNTMAQHEDNVRLMVEQLQTTEGTQQFEQDVYTRLQEAMNDEEILIEINAYGDALTEIQDRLVYLSEQDPNEMTELERATYDLLAVVREMGNRSTITLEDLPRFEGLDEAMQADVEEIME